MFVAHIMGIGAYDFQETALVSILVDFLPDEVSREVNMRVDTVGKNAVSVKNLQAMIDRIMHDP